MSISIAEFLREYVEYTVKKLVDNPDEVQVFSSVSTKSVIIQVKVAKSDCGKVIGKRGRSIESLKVLVLAIKNTNFSGDNKRISLEILEDEESNFSY